MREYDVGDLVKVTGEFSNPSNDAALDPTTVKLWVLDPSGNRDTYIYDGVNGDASEDGRIWRSAAGFYHFNIDVDEEGVWRYRWYSTGLGKASDEEYFKAKTDFTIGTGT